jgi:glycosyltransferase involved in cell wall biosynthesis
MRRRIDLSLVLACRNLEPNLSGNLRQILHTLSLSHLTFELILIDDYSDDTTAQTIKDFKKSSKRKYPRMIVACHKKRLGRAVTVTEGIERAKAPVVGIMSPGLGISPVYIPLALDTIATGAADILVARRIFHPKSNPLVRFAYFLMAKVTSMFVYTGNADVYSSFKFFNRKKIKPLIAKVKHTGRMWDVELLILANRIGLKIGELPVVYRPKTETLELFNLPDEAYGFMTDLLGLWRRMYLKARGMI